MSFVWSDEQRSILEFELGRSGGQIVSAGAGTGKTTVVVEKIRRLLMEEPEARIVAVSFTNKSALELSERLFNVLETLHLTGSLRYHWIATLHQVCGNILRDFPEESRCQSGFVILDEKEALALWWKALYKLYYGNLPEEVSQALRSTLSVFKRVNLEEILEESREKIHLSDSADAFYKTLNHRELETIIRWVTEHYEREKVERNAIDFSDLEKFACLALEYAHVRHYYHEKFKYVFIDEAQDLNRKQYQILSQFCRSALRFSFFVGDVKQSIYRFRGADLSVFNTLLTHRELTKFNLTINRRSQAQILNLTNQVCEPLFNHPFPYEALVPPELKTSTHGEWPAVMKVEGDIEALYSALVKLRASSKGRVVILCQSVSSKVDSYWVKLKSKGLKLVLQNGEGFWDDPRTIDLTHLALAWFVPDANREMVGVLLSPLFDVSAKQIDTWIQEGFETESLLEKFLKSSHRFAGIMRASKTPAHSSQLRFLEDLMQDESFSREYGVQCLFLWHRLHEYAREGLSHAEGIRQMIKESKEHLTPGLNVPPVQTDDVIEIMTVHSSKGLEFDSVVLIDFGGPKNRGTNRLPSFIWDQEAGQYFVRQSVSSDDFKKKELIYRTEMDAHDDELKRLLYVALTRAKKNLLLYIPPVKPTKTAKASNASAKGWRLWLENASVLENISDIANLPLVHPEQLVSSHHSSAKQPKKRPWSESGWPKEYRKVRPRHSVSEWLILKQCDLRYYFLVNQEREIQKWDERASLFMSRSVIEDIGDEEGARGSERDPLQRELVLKDDGFSGGPSLRRFGTELHRVLEDPTPARLNDLVSQFKEKPFSTDAVLAWVNESPWMQSVSPPGLSAAEFAFEVPVTDASVLLGIMDRIYVSPERDFAVVLDYKLTTEQTSDESLKARYGLQLGLYAESLRLMLPSETKIRTLLVKFTEREVKEIEVPYAPIALAALADQAQSVLNLELAQVPVKTGRHCRYCPFLTKCQAGTQFLA